MRFRFERSFRLAFVPPSLPGEKKRKERKDRQCFNNRVYNGTCLASSSLISLSPTIARSKFLERDRESLCRFYSKKVAKMIRQTSPSVDVNNPSLLERRNEKTFALAYHRSLGPDGDRASSVFRK